MSTMSKTTCSVLVFMNEAEGNWHCDFAEGCNLSSSEAT
jgi:hypothetical protein